MTFEWKKVSIPINRSIDFSGGDITELIERTTRLMKYNLFCPNRTWFYLKGEFDTGFYEARNKWKQGLVGFASVKEYKLFHERMV